MDLDETQRCLLASEGRSRRPTALIAACATMQANRFWVKTKSSERATADHNTDRRWLKPQRKWDTVNTKIDRTVAGQMPLNRL